MSVKHLISLLFVLCKSAWTLEAQPPASVPASQLQKRWLFVWRNLNDPKEADRAMARFPKAAAAGYNGIVLSHNVAPSKAGELKEAAKQNHLDLIAIVMGGIKDRNY